MSEPHPTTKSELLEATEHAWAALNEALARLTEAQMTTVTDAAGWTVKDHLVHLAAWERSALFFIQGKARHEALGVEEALYLEDDEDAINAAIHEQHRHLPLAEALTQLRTTHEQFLEALEPLTDADLERPYRHYLPDEPGDGAGPPAMKVLYGNSAHHFSEHLAWMEALAGRQP